MTVSQVKVGEDTIQISFHDYFPTSHSWGGETFNVSDQDEIDSYIAKNSAWCKAQHEKKTD